MLKPTLFFSIIFFAVSGAKATTADTTVLYFKNSSIRPKVVNSPDYADFIRVLYPSGTADAMLIVKDYYKNGHLKSIGKVKADYLETYLSDRIRLEGDCITYLPNGKKQSITKYDNGYEKSEYLFYPDGKVYCYKKYKVANNGVYDDDIYWECYNRNGDMICANGNGHWLLYDPGFENIVLEGQVKKGNKEGEWRGVTVVEDTVKYVYRFKNDLFLSGTGYDKNGTAYPFAYQVENVSYEGSLFAFIDNVKRYLEIPKDSTGKKMSVDTVRFAVTIEKDGSLTEYEPVGSVNLLLKSTIADAINKTKNLWKPRRYFGIPLRTTLILPLKYESGYYKDTRLFYKVMPHNEHIIGF